MGARVAVDPSLYCGYCRRCRSGRDNLCENWAAIGDTVDGAFAEYVAVPAVNAHRLPGRHRRPARRDDRAARLRGARPAPARPLFGDSVVLTGAGDDGAAAAAAARARGGGAGHGRRPGRRPAGGRPQARRRARRGRPGRADGRAVRDRGRRDRRPRRRRRRRPALLDRGGRLLVFGVAPAEATISLSPFRVYNDEITVTGSMAILRSFGPAVELIGSGAIDPARCCATAGPGPVRRGPAPGYAPARASRSRSPRASDRVTG